VEQSGKLGRRPGIAKLLMMRNGRESTPSDEVGATTDDDGRRRENGRVGRCACGVMQ
jgi:hypothetical protein